MSLLLKDLLRNSICIWFLCSSLLLNSQTNNTSISLNLFTVTANVDVPISFKKKILQEEIYDDISSSLGDVLTRNSTLYIKDYGKGQLNSISFRGTGASQTQLYWNGFLVNAPTLGQSDLSLFPTFFNDEVQLHYGHSSMVDGSGGLGGSIQINNRSNFKVGLSTEIMQEVASFGNYTTAAKLNWTNSKQNFTNQVKLYRSTGVNDFKFIDLSKADRPKVKQQNNEVVQEGLQYQLGFIKRRNRFNATAFYFNSRRNLPTIIGASYKGESQWDEHFRSQIDYKRDGLFNNRLLLNPKLGYFVENSIYKDSSSGLISKAQTISIQPQLITKLNLRKGKWLVANITANNSIANSDGFEDKKIIRQEYAIMTKWEHVMKRVGYNIMLRQAVIDTDYTPFTYAVGLLYRLKNYDDRFTFKTSFAKNFRYPTLNDLYWRTGGNINLLPEEGYSGELGFEGKLPNYTFKLNGFYGKIDNWIQWVPGLGNFWSPQNIKSVENSGIEASFDYKRTVKQLNVDCFMGLDYAYTNSIVKVSEIGNDLSVGKQLIYVPKHKLNINAKVVTDYVTISASQQFTSRVYIDATNSIYLPGYMPANIMLSSKLFIKKYAVELNLAAKNIFDEPYHVVANRPVPGRNYSLTVRFSYN